MKLITYFALMLFATHLEIALGLCPEDMEHLNLTHFQKIKKEGSVIYYYEEKIHLYPMKIYLEFYKDMQDVSVIASKKLKKSENEKDIGNSFTMEFTKDKNNDIFFQIQRCLKENGICLREGSPTKISERLSDTEIKKYEISIHYDKIRIYSQNKFIYEEEVEFQKIFGETSYVQIRTIANSQKISVENFDFAICHSLDISKIMRKLQEGMNEGGEFDHLEVDANCIEASPNYLREGNVEIIPTVKLDPKDKDGKFPSNILKYSTKSLNELVKLEHNGGAIVKWKATINWENKLILCLKTYVPGEIYLTSDYFKDINFTNYIIKVNPIEINPEKTFAKIDEPEQIAGKNFTLKIYPFSKYGTNLAFVEQSEIEKLQIKVTLPNRTIIDVEGGEFDPDEKAILFNQNYISFGEIQYSIKYDNVDISCTNCQIEIIFGDIDFKKSVQYSDIIELGEISNLTIIPRDEYNNSLPIKEITDKLDIKCIFDNKTLNITIKSDEENNQIVLSNDNIIKKQGNLTWIILYKNNSNEFIVIIKGDEEIENSKFYISINDTIEEIKENNTKITFEINPKFAILVKLFDKYSNLIEVLDAATVIKAKMYGNDMMPIHFNITREKNNFNLLIPENNTEDFLYLVSGYNYEIEIQLTKGNNKAIFYFPVNLTSSENDEGYGNGVYNLSHSTFEPNETSHKMIAGEIYELFLNLRTEKDLLYHRKLDINDHITYKIASEDKTFNFKAYNLNSTLGIYKIELFSTISMENELTLLLDDIEIEEKPFLDIQSNPVPYVNNCEIVNRTESIEEDLDPIVISVLLRDIYNNTFTNRKDVLYKKKLFIMIDDEKPEQNIELDSDNKTYILKYVSEKNESSLNLTLAFNNSGDLLIIENNIIVNFNIKTFYEPEKLAVNIEYKPGKAFVYKYVKDINANIKMEDTETLENITNIAEFIIYIRDKYFEKGGNNSKVVWYTGYFGLINYLSKNSSEPTETSILQDTDLIEVLKENKVPYFSMKNNENKENGNEKNDKIAFIKIDFNQNGELKNIYNPNSKKFTMENMQIIKELIGLVIPKISSDLFSDNIYEELDEILKQENYTNNKSGLLRRLSEETKKRRKVSNDYKKRIKKVTYRILQENTTDENDRKVEQTLIPNEADIDVNLRQLDKAEDNSSQITLLSLQNFQTPKGKLLGSLNNKTVHTNITSDGLVNSIKQVDNAVLTNETKDEIADNYIYKEVYDENSLFQKDDFEFEDIEDTEPPNNTLGLTGMELDSINSIDLLSDFMDDNGTLIEYFSSVEYIEFNESAYEDYLLTQMGGEFLEHLNATNYTVMDIEVKEREIIELANESSSTLRNLDDSERPYYGQKKLSNIKYILDTSLLGLSIKKYTETINYPHNGKILVQTIFSIGALKYTVDKQEQYSNNHILIKNTNCLGNDLIELISDKLSDKILNDEFLNTLKSSSNILYSIFVPQHYSDIFEGFKEFAKNKSNIYETFNFVYNSIMQYHQNVNKTLEDLKENKIESISNFRESLKRLYSDYIDLMVNKTELFKQKTVVVFKKIYNATSTKLRISDTETQLADIQGYETLYNLLTLIQECKDNITNFKSNLFADIDKKLASFISDIQDIYLVDPYNISINNLISGIQENITIAPSEEKIKDILSKLKIIRQYKKNFTSELERLLKEDCQSVLSAKAENIETKLQSHYTEILSGINEAMQYIEANRLDIKFHNETNLYQDNLNYLYSAINKTLYELQDFFEKIFYSKFINIKREYFDQNSALLKTKKDLFDIADNILKLNLKYESNMNDEEIQSYKNEMNSLLNSYNNTLLNFLQEGFLDDLKKNISFSENEINFDFLENNLKMISEFYYNNYYLKNRSSFLEYPDEIIMTIKSIPNNFIKNRIIDYVDNFNCDLKEFILNLENTTKSYISNFILFHKKYILSQLNDDTILFTVQDQKERFEDLFRYILNFVEGFNPKIVEGFGNGGEGCPKYIPDNIFVNPMSTIISNFTNWTVTFESRVNEYFRSQNCQTNCWTEKDEDSKKKYQPCYFSSILISKMLNMKNFTNYVKNKYGAMNENDLNIFKLPEPDLNFIKEDYSYNESFYNMKETLTEKYGNISDNLYNILNEETIYIRYNYNHHNYSKIAEEYKKIINGDNENFKQYYSNIFDNLNTSLLSLIDEYNKTLFDFINGYKYEYDNFSTFTDYFNGLKNALKNNYTYINQKILDLSGASSSSSNNGIQAEDFNSYFKNNFTSIMENKKNYFINLVERENFDISMMNKKLNLTEYILNQINEDDIQNSVDAINNMPSFDMQSYLNEIKDSISTIGNNIQTLFNNVTDNFLNYFKSNRGLSKAEKSALASQISYGECWELRGQLLSDIKVEDQNNYLDYLSYIEIKNYVEQNCTIDGKINYENCLYSESDIQIVNYTNKTEFYLDCQKRGKIYKKKITIFNSVGDFDLDKINEEFKGLVNILDNCYNFETIITDYFYNRYSINDFKGKTIKSLGINKKELEKTMFIESYNSKKEFLSSLKQELVNNFRFVYSDYLNFDSKFIHLYKRLYYNKLRTSYEYFFSDYVNEGFFVEVLKKMNSIPYHLRNKLLNIVDSVYAEYRTIMNNYDNWRISYVNKFYKTEFSNKVINQYYNELLKQYFINDLKIYYFEDYLNDIIEDDDVYSTLMKFLDEKYKYYFINFVNFMPNTLYNASIPGNSSFYIHYYSKDLGQPFRYTYTDVNVSNLIEDYRANNGIENINFNFNFSINNLYSSNYNNCINTIFDSSYVDNLIREIEQNKEADFKEQATEMPNYFVKFKNESLDNFKDVFAKMDAPFKEILNLISNFTDNLGVEFDSWINNLISYTYIRDLFYMNSPCKAENCPGKFEVGDIKEEINAKIKSGNGVRNLEENKLYKIIQDTVKKVKKEKHHKNRYKHLEYLYKTDTLENNKIRHLEYNENSEAKQEKDVLTALSNLQYWTDSLSENVYQIKGKIRTLRDNYLNNIIQNFLENLSKNVTEINEDLILRIEAKNYQKYKKVLYFYYETIRDYVNNITNYISKKSDKYLNSLDNAYDYFYCFSGLSNKKLYTYYKTFLFLISTKYSVVKEDYYKKYFGVTPNQFDIIGDPNSHDTYLTVARLAFEDEVEKNQDLMKGVLALNYEALLNLKVELGFHNITGEEEEDPDILEMDFDADDFELEDIIKEDDKGKKYVTKTHHFEDDDDDNKKKDDKDSEDKSTDTKKKDKSFMEEVEKSVEVDLEFTIKNWQIYFNLKITAKLEYGDDKKWGVETIIAFPAFPLFQIRIGIRFEIGFKITAGAEFTLKRDEKDGFGAQFKILIEFEVYAKLIAYAQAGIYLGKEPFEVSVYGGVDGTIIEARAGFKLYFYIGKNEMEVFIYLQLYTFTFRAYIEAKAKLFGFIDWKKPLFDKRFGMTTPIGELGLYIKYNYYGEVIARKETAQFNIAFG